MVFALLLFCQLSIECDNPETVGYIQAEYDLVMEIVEAYTGRVDMPALTISCPEATPVYLYTYIPVWGKIVAHRINLPLHWYRLMLLHEVSHYLISVWLGGNVRRFAGPAEGEILTAALAMWLQTQMRHRK